MMMMMKKRMMITVTKKIKNKFDADVVAMLSMTNSKTISGIKHLSSKQEWLACVEKLDSEIKKYNENKKANKKIKVDKLRNMINNPKQFTNLQNIALVIRDKSNTTTFTQSDIKNQLYIKNPRTSYNQNVDESYIKEIIQEGITDVITYSNGKKKTLNSSNPNEAIYIKSKVGKNNIVYNSKYNDQDNKKSYTAQVSIKYANQIPNCTFAAIEKILEKVITYDNCEYREFVIKLPKDAEGTKLGQWYEQQVIDYKSLKFDVAKKMLDSNKKSGKPLDSIIKELNFLSGNGRTGAIRVLYEGV